MEARKIKLSLIIHQILLIIAIFIVVPAQLCAQVNEFNVSSYNTSNGICNDDITTLFTDSSGLLWIGTNDGLMRFDGYRFTSYRYRANDSNCIAGNIIRDIDEGPDGNLWIATAEYGICIWHRRSDKFVCLNNNPSKTQLPESDILGMKIINNKVMVKTKNYLSIIDPITFNIESAPIIENLTRKYALGKVSMVPVRGGSEIFIGGIDGCHLYNIDNKRFVKSGDFLNSIRSVYQIEPMGDKWMISSNSGLYICDDSLNMTNEYPLYRYDFGNSGISTAGDTAIWIVGNNSLEYINIKTGELKTYINDINPTKETGVFGVSTIFEDNHHNLWVGTKHSGLLRLDLKKPKFAQLNFINDHVFPAQVSELNINDKGTLFFAAGTKGVGISHYAGQRQNNLKVNYIKIEDKEVTSILLRKDGNIWIGTDAGIHIMRSYDYRITEFDYTKQKEFENLIGQNKINALMEDKLGNVWIATSFGLFKYNGKSIISYFCRSINGDTELCNDWVNTVYEDKQGWIWVGTNEGLRYMAPGDNDFTYVCNTNAEETIIANNHVLSFGQLSDHEILIGTRSGLTTFSKNNNSLYIFPNNRQLNNDAINTIVIDDLKQIWVGTNNGASLIKKTQEILNFHNRDGLRNTYFQKKSLLLNNGIVYFAGVNGINYIDPADITINNTTSKLVFSNITSEHRNGSLKQIQINTPEIRLRYKRGQIINFEFSSLDFTFPERCLYKTFIEGYDQRWSKPDENSTLTVYSLPPGKYTLNVMGSNSDHVWEMEPLQVKINIVPPLWQTKYAYAFYFLMMLVVLHLLGNYRLLKIRRKYHSLEAKSNSKILIEEQRNQLATVHQSLTDSINYAKRIQEALIPSEEVVRTLFNEAFVYFRPKDIVSGDFYWSYENDTKQIIIVADCTGHGVPGAFMSIIGLDLIKNAVEQQQLYNPAHMLTLLNRGIHSTFASSGNNDAKGFHINDGMDIAVCVIDKPTGTMEFAGGMSTIYLIRDNEMFSYKGDRRPIGSVASGETYEFEQHTIQLQDNDFIYMFSDGYADQFGGPEGKKFKYRRFRHLLLNIHKLPAMDQKNIIHQKFEEWIGDSYEQIDDILILGFSYTQSKDTQ